MKINKDYIWRVVKTFIQTFLSAAVVELIVILKEGIDLTDKNAVKGLVIAVLSAGFAAVMNLNKVKAEPQEVFEEIPEDEFITEDESC